MNATSSISANPVVLAVYSWDNKLLVSGLESSEGLNWKEFGRRMMLARIPELSDVGLGSEVLPEVWMDGAGMLRAEGRWGAQKKRTKSQSYPSALTETKVNLHRVKASCVVSNWLFGLSPGSWWTNIPSSDVQPSQSNAIEQSAGYLSNNRSCRLGEQ